MEMWVRRGGSLDEKVIDKRKPARILAARGGSLWKICVQLHYQVWANLSVRLKAYSRMLSVIGRRGAWSIILSSSPLRLLGWQRLGPSSVQHLRCLRYHA